MSNRDAPPLPVCVKVGGRLIPATAYDAEALNRWPNGAEFEARSLTKRSVPHLKLYWVTLGKVVAAMGRDEWPTAEKLHNSLKLSLGYIEMIWDADRKHWVPSLDSIALSAMTQADFNEFHGKAMAKLVEWCGFDPMEIVDQ